MLFHNCESKYSGCGICFPLIYLEDCNNPRPKSTSWKSWIAILNIGKAFGHPNVHLSSRPSHPSIYLPPWWWRTYSRMDIQRNRITEELRQSICASFSQHLRTDFGSEGTKYFLDKGTIISGSHYFLIKDGWVTKFEQIVLPKIP